MLGYSTKVFDYNINEYPFDFLAECCLGCELTNLQSNAVSQLQVGGEKHSPLHQRLYRIGKPFHRMYEWFLKNEVFKELNPSLYLYQAVPTWRVQLLNNVATGSFHRDSDFHHSIHSLNYCVALTPMVETSSIWIESQPEAKDHAPLCLSLGQYARFHGSILEHGSHRNQTGKTRVSFDFRLLPKEYYQPTNAKSISMGVKLRLGAYYSDGASLVRDLG